LGSPDNTVVFHGASTLKSSLFQEPCILTMDFPKLDKLLKKKSARQLDGITFNPLSPSINIHTLFTILLIFLILLIGRI